MATVRFNGATVENDTACLVDISPCGIVIASGGVTRNVQCNSDGVFVRPYGKFYSWNSSAVLNPGDIGVFTVCNSREVTMNIYRTCQGCRKMFQTTLKAVKA